MDLGISFTATHFWYQWTKESYILFMITCMYIYIHICKWSKVIHDSESVPISQKQDGCNIFVIMKTITTMVITTIALQQLRHSGGRTYSNFPHLDLNADRYWLSLRSQSECEKIQTRKTLDTDTLHAVIGVCVCVRITSFIPLVSG